MPIIVGDEPTLIRFTNDLRAHGVYANIVTYPAVRRKECRVRLCVMKDLTKQDLDKALAVITEQGKKHGII